MKEKHLEKQQGITETVINETIPNFLDLMEMFLENNGGQYFVGSDVSNYKKCVIFDHANVMQMITICICYYNIEIL